MTEADSPTDYRTTEEENLGSLEYQTQYKAVEVRLGQSAPELLEGKLPSELEVRLGGLQYALGTNQTDGASTAQEAADLLVYEDGIPVDNYNLYQRFLIFGNSNAPAEKEYTKEAVVRGYYGPDMGRFVVAFPLVHGEAPHPMSPAQVMRSVEGEDFLPQDFYKNGHKLVNSKYCAGFIDKDGLFHENPRFMEVDDAPNIDRVALTDQFPKADPQQNLFASAGSSREIIEPQQQSETVTEDLSRYLL